MFTRIASTLLLSCVLYFTCTTPTNPADNPDNVIITITNQKAPIVQNVGDSLSIKLSPNYPQLINFIRVKYSNHYDTLFVKPLPDSLIVSSIIQKIGLDTIFITTQFSNLKTKDTFFIFTAQQGTQLDLIGPTIQLLNNIPDSIVILSISKKIECVVQDPSGISRVRYSIGTDTFPVTKFEDTLYYAFISGLVSGVYSKIEITAWDASTSKNRTIKSVYIKYDPTAFDAFGPIITFMDPTKDSTIVSANYRKIQFSVKDSSRISNTKITLGTDSFTVIRTNDTLFYATVSNLQNGIFNKIIITAWDSATARNKSISNLFIKYDATLPDSAAPSILWKSGPKQAGKPARITDSTGALTYEISDQSGIDTVYFLLNGKSAAIPSVSGNQYTFNYNVGNRYHLDTIKIVAVDNATKHNQGEEIIILDYDTRITQVLLQAPISNEIDVSKTPLFKWAGGNDADGDPVTFKFFWGFRKDSLTNTKTNISTKEIQPTVALPGNSRIYWTVRAYSSIYSEDSITAKVDSFITARTATRIRLISPAQGIPKVNPLEDTLIFAIDSIETRKVGFTILLDTTRALFSTLNRKTQNNFTCPIANFPNIKGAKKYFWTIIVTDSGATGISKDTAKVDSFYTLNNPPQWKTLPSPHDTSYYRILVDLSKLCSDPDGNQSSFFVKSTNATISGSNLAYKADSQNIIITAKDNFLIQPCSSTVTMQAFWFRNKRMKYVPPSSFIMGDTNDNRGKVLHPVTTNAFVMDSTEVTQQDYQNLMGSNPSVSKWSTLLPVSCSWFEAVLYSNARSKKDGFDTIYTYSKATHNEYGLMILDSTKPSFEKYGYRLPTEAEWESACRAGTSTKYYWGNTEIEDSVKMYAWYDKNSRSDSWTNPHATTAGPQIVAQKVPNKYKLYDMVGNVYEWVNDWYTMPYPSEPQVNPIGPDTGSFKMLRGGSFMAWVDLLSSGARDAAAAEDTYGGSIGFRVILPSK